MKANPNAQFYTVAEAAERLGITTITLRKAVDAGTVPAVRIGPRTVRIPKTYIQSALSGTASNG